MAILLGNSLRQSALTASELANDVEGVALAQIIQQNLNTHHRQALLNELRTKAQRRSQIEVSGQNLLDSINSISKYSLTSEEGSLIVSIKQSIISYLLAFERQRQKGVRETQLFASVAEEHGHALAAIHDFIRFNLKETRELQIKIYKQNQLSLIFVSLAAFLLITTIGFFLAALRRLLYIPIVSLKKNIDAYELGNNLEVETATGAIEINAITASFHKLSQKLSKQKDLQLTFLSAIAHDLKNPLGAIKMSAEIMSEDHLSEQNKEMLAIIGRQTSHLQRLIEDLMDTTRIESGHMDLRFEVSDIRRLVSDSVTLHSSLSAQHVISAELPPFPVEINCDEQRLSQVFNNLLNNALKYSPHGGEIKVQLAVSGDQVLVNFWDTGIGILPEDLEGVFEPFRRSNSTKNIIPGVGLGLSVSQKIIRAHKNADLFVTSKYGQGSLFSVRLELYKQDRIAGLIDQQL